MKKLLGKAFILALLAVAGCGGSDEPRVIEVPTADVVIKKDCGYYGGMTESKVIAVEATCREALDVANSIGESNCNFSEPGSTCDVIGFECRRLSDAGDDTFVAECVEGAKRVTVEAPVIRE